ncbi:cell division protein SepF [Mycoplasma capricolum]|uniref:cell division protein SepF n=1 Tax=Mycoplasma capricolum TaxID=2095 RepID=UPI0022F3A1F7|nr:cell division protein SepF [Mycoplasma capricolum]WBX36019.1 cell division protein SepF [Mycoplasma capricolum subsp. capricolum]
MFFKKKKSSFKQDDKDQDQIEFELNDSDFYENESPILKDSHNQQSTSNQNYQTNSFDNDSNFKDNHLDHLDFEKTPVNTYVFSPMKFSEIQSIVDTLLEHSVVVIDFKNLDDNKAKRFKDFLSGVLYVKKGEYIRLNENIYKFIIKN